MNWLMRYRIRHFVQNTVWVIPLFGLLGALICVRLTFWMDQKLGWQATVDIDSARALLATIASSLFTFIVFVSSALLVAVQLASAQLTPRIIAVVFQNLTIKIALTIFLFAFVYALSALIRIRDSVPQLTTNFAAICCIVSLAYFLVMIDQIGKTLRPSGALRAVGIQGRAVLKSVYPSLLTESSPDQGAIVSDFLNSAPTQVLSKHRDGVVLAFDVRGLVNLARQADCIIEMVPQVGDDVASGDPILRVFGGRTALDEHTLNQSVAVGMERTMEQDATFAFRIIVDIASKGLSPAINDPTTAVLAIDQLHHLLRYVGKRNLETGVVYDSAGKLRLVYRTPDWEDFVRLAVTEIRQFGGESIQIARRLRAMLENLIQTLPESRTQLLRDELVTLKRSAERIFAEPEDRAMAEISDSLGVGGRRSRKQV